MLTLIKNFIADPDNLEEVTALIQDFNDSDVMVTNKQKQVEDRLKELNELDVLEQFLKGIFS